MTWLSRLLAVLEPDVHWPGETASADSERWPEACNEVTIRVRTAMNVIWRPVLRPSLPL